MKKILLLIIILVGNLAAVSRAQTSGQSGFSESISYEPRVFKDAKGNVVDAYGKRLKEKKANSTKTDGQSRQTIIQTPAKTADFALSVYVFDKNGQPVKSLNPQDFKLFINDAEQVIENVQVNNAPLNIIVALDVSNSTTTDSKDVKNSSAISLTDIKNFALRLIDHLPVESRIKIIAFDERIRVLNSFTDDRSVLKSSIAKITAGGSTSIYEFIENVLKTQLDGKTIILELTDGVDTTSPKATYETSLKTVEQSDVVIFPFYLNTEEFASSNGSKTSTYVTSLPIAGTIGAILGAPVKTDPLSIKEDYERGRNYLLDSAAISGGRAFETGKIKDLPDNDFEFIAKTVQPQYLLKFHLPEAVYPDNRIKIKIRVSRPSLIVRTQGSRISS